MILPDGIGSAMKTSLFPGVILPLCLFILTGLFWRTAPALAATTVMAEGVAALHGHPAVARERALDDALRRAVEQAVGIQVSADTLTERYRVIHDKILAQTSGYIRTYRIISEKRTNGLFRVKISAEVATGNLRNDLQSLGLLQVLAERPSLMVIMEEQVVCRYETDIGDDPVRLREDIGQSEASLIETFINNGFRVVDSKTVKAVLNRRQALLILNGDNRAASAAGLQAGAQIVIVGKAMAKSAPANIRNTNMQSVQATVQARAIRSDDAVVITARSVHRAKAHIDAMQGSAMALEAAGQELGNLLGRDILNKWQEEVYGRKREVTLAITGLGSLSNLQAVSDYLKKNMQGVKAVYQRSYVAGNAELMLDYSGKSSHVAAELALHKFAGFRLEPVSVTPNRLDVRVIRD
jgi:hypothetical protein